MANEKSTKTNRTYRSWANMIQRCTNPNNTGYPQYGGRGITVCARWRHYDNFFKDMGERPHQHSLDRIDNSGPYSPNNCRWATVSEQNRNSRANRMVTYNGQTLTCAEWSEITGVHLSTIASRLHRGWSPVEAITAPNCKGQRRDLI